MLTLPDLLSLVRLLCTLPFLLLCAQLHLRHTTGLCVSTLGLYAIITGSDILDGWLARRLAVARPAGRMVDHTCDILFILITLGFFTVRQVVPWWVPVTIACAFVLYVIDSWRRSAHQPQRTLLASRIGHVSGMLNYATVGLATVHLCLDAPGLSARLLSAWYYGVSLLACCSGAERGWLLVRDLRAHAARARRAGNTHQSNHSEP